MADIVFLVDGSASIGLSNFQQIRDFLSSLVSNFDIAPNKVRIGLVQFSDTPRTEFYLKTYENKQQILDYIRQLPYKTGGTNTGLGLEFLLKSHFVEEAGSRAKWNVPQISVVITDGNSQDEVEPHAQELRQKGIKLYAIGIKDADEKLLKQIANQPYDQYVYSVSDFTALQEISQNSETISLIADCREITSADIVLLVDSSDSVGDTNFAEIRRFLHTFVDRLEIGGDKVRVGLAQFSHAPYQEFLLDAYRDKANLLKQLENIMYHKGGTNIAKALDFIRESYFSQARKNVPRIAIVITNGNTNDTAEEAAQKLRQQGVVIFVIKTGQADATHLSTVANSPQEEFLFSVDTYQKLDGLSSGHLENVMQSCKFTAEADMYFLLDESGSISYDDFDDMKAFILEFLHVFEIGPDQVRIGVVKFADKATPVFHLNTYNTKAKVQKAVKALFMEGGGTRTDLGLEEMIPLFKQAEQTRKKKVREFLIVITDGKSEHVGKPLKVHAEQLRKQNVTIYAIGVKDADKAELEDMSGSPKRTFFVNNYDALKEIKSKILKEICSFEGEDFMAEL
uniref:Collagen, type VI, alpha 4b n=1 Tax=Electrophorus electricus TaxID=8005 RepID=A0A4W4FGZ2_ELEEL